MAEALKGRKSRRGKGPDGENPPVDRGRNAPATKREGLGDSRNGSAFSREFRPCPWRQNGEPGNSSAPISRSAGRPPGATGEGSRDPGFRVGSTAERTFASFTAGKGAVKKPSGLRRPARPVKGGTLASPLLLAIAFKKHSMERGLGSDNLGGPLWIVDEERFTPSEWSSFAQVETERPFEPFLILKVAGPSQPISSSFQTQSNPRSLGRWVDP